MGLLSARFWPVGGVVGVGVGSGVVVPWTSSSESCPAGQPVLPGDAQPHEPDGRVGDVDVHGVGLSRVERVARRRLQGGERRAVGGALHGDGLRPRTPGAGRQLEGQVGDRGGAAEVHLHPLRELVVGGLPVRALVAVRDVAGAVDVHGGAGGGGLARGEVRAGRGRSLREDREAERCDERRRGGGHDGEPDVPSHAHEVAPRSPAGGGVDAECAARVSSARRWTQGPDRRRGVGAPGPSSAATPFVGPRTTLCVLAVEFLRGRDQTLRTAARAVKGGPEELHTRV